MELRTYIDVSDGNGYLRVFPVEYPEFSWKKINGFGDLRMEMSNNLVLTNDYVSGSLDYDRLTTIATLSTVIGVEVRAYYSDTDTEHLFFKGICTTLDYSENDIDKSWLEIKVRTWDKYHDLEKVYDKEFDYIADTAMTEVWFKDISITDLYSTTYKMQGDVSPVIITDDENNTYEFEKHGVDGNGDSYVNLYRHPYLSGYVFWDDQSSVYAFAGKWILGDYYDGPSKWNPHYQPIILNGRFHFVLDPSYVDYDKTWVTHNMLKTYRLYDVITTLLTKCNVGLNFRCDEWLADNDWYDLFLTNLGSNYRTSQELALKPLMEDVAKLFNGYWRIVGNELIFKAYKDETIPNGTIDLTNYSHNGKDYGDFWAKRTNLIRVKSFNIPTIEKFIAEGGKKNSYWDTFKLYYDIASYGEIKEEEIEITTFSLDFKERDLRTFNITSDELVLVAPKRNETYLDYNETEQTGYVMMQQLLWGTLLSAINGNVSLQSLFDKFWRYNRFMEEASTGENTHTLYSPKKYREQKLQFPYTHYVFEHNKQIKTEQGWGIIDSAKWSNGMMEVTLKF